MQTSTPAVVAAIESTEAEWGRRCTITWSDSTVLVLDDSMIVSADVEADLIGDMPDAADSTVGYLSRKLTIVVDGLCDGTDEAKDFYWLLSPMNQDSPLWGIDPRGARIFYEEGPFVDGSVEPYFFAQFTGSIDDVAFEADGSHPVTLTCLDRMNDLTATVSMPAVVTVPPYNANLTSEFGHDALLRAASGGAISTWPAQRPHAIFAASLESSIQPEVGTIDFSIQPPFVTFGRGPFGTGVSDTGKWPGTSNPIPQFVTLGGAASNNQHLEFLFTSLGQSGTSDALSLGVGVPHSPTAGIWQIAGLLLQVEYNKITVLDAGADVWTVAVDAGVHRVILDATRSGGNWSGTVRLASYDGTTWTSVTHALSGVASTDPSTFTSAGYLVAGKGGVMAGPQLSNETAPSYVPFYPQAILDESLNMMDGTPAVSGDPKDVIKDICTADRTVAGFDELGIYRSNNRVSRRGGFSVRDVRSDSTLATVGIELTGAGFANHVTAGYTGLKFGAAATVWSADTIHHFAPGLGQRLRVSTGDVMVADIDGTISQLPDVAHGGPVAGQSYYLASSDINGVNQHRGLRNGRIVQIDPTTFDVYFDNILTHNAYTISYADFTDIAPATPTLIIGGIPVTIGDTAIADAQWPPLAEGGAKSTQRGDVPYDFPDNSWRQRIESAQPLVDDTLVDMRRLRPVFTNVVVSTQYDLQLGDRIHLYAPELYLDDDVIVFGIKGSSSAGEASQALNVRMVAEPGGWILGQIGRSELGITTRV